MSKNTLSKTLKAREAYRTNAQRQLGECSAYSDVWTDDTGAQRQVIVRNGYKRIVQVADDGFGFLQVVAYLH